MLKIIPCAICGNMECTSKLPVCRDCERASVVEDIAIQKGQSINLLGIIVPKANRNA